MLHAHCIGCECGAVSLTRKTGTTIFRIDALQGLISSPFLEHKGSSLKAARGTIRLKRVPLQQMLEVKMVAEACIGLTVQLYCILSAIQLVVTQF